MQLVEKHIINKSHSAFVECKSLCIRSKNLYNKANYIVRQEFIKTSKEKEEGLREYAIYLNYQDVRRILLSSQEYVSLPRKVSNQTLILLDKNWKSFFKAIKDYGKNNDKYSGKPKLPNYKKEEFITTYELGAISKKCLNKNSLCLSGTDIAIPTKRKNIKQSRIIPKNGIYQIEIIYEVPDVHLLSDNKKYVGIDLGVNNLATLTSNDKEFNPLIVNGKPLKSINQFYNKKLALYKSKLKDKYISNKINKLTNKRNNKINDYMHKASKFIVDKLTKSDINTLIIGKNKNWKQETNMSKQNNQNFVNIPHGTFIHMLIYKAGLKGINVIEQEESYTSKASFLNLDPIPIYKPNEISEHTFSGYRKNRGLYKIKNENKTINADVNGSYNIIRKAVPNAFANGIEDLSVNPMLITININ